MYTLQSFDNMYVIGCSVSYFWILISLPTLNVLYIYGPVMKAVDSRLPRASGSLDRTNGSACNAMSFSLATLLLHKSLEVYRYSEEQVVANVFHRLQEVREPNPTSDRISPTFHFPFSPSDL